MTRQILIVEDEQLLLRTLTKALRRGTSYEVSGVESVRAARETLEHFRPHLVICDLGLDDGTGLEVIDLLRRHGLAIPVVILSGQVERFEGSIPKGQGMHVRRKPLPARELLELVETVLAPTEDDVDLVTAFGITDYLQMAQYSGRSMRIEVRTGRQSGCIMMWQGDVWGARFGDAHGSEAIAEMLRASAFVGRTKVLEEPPEPREVELPTHALLLELCRVQDEQVHSGEIELEAPEAAPDHAEINKEFAGLVSLVAEDRLEDAVESIACLRSMCPEDVRLNAWWVDAVAKRWSERPKISNGGVA